MALKPGFPNLCADCRYERQMREQKKEQAVFAVQASVDVRSEEVPPAEDLERFEPGAAAVACSIPGDPALVRALHAATWALKILA